MNENLLADQIIEVNTKTALKPASFFHRIAALIIDLIILNIVLLPLGASMAFRRDDTIGFRLDDISIPVAFSYYFLSDWLIRGTPAKKILGLRVNDNRGNKLSFGTALLRCLARLVTLVTVGLGFITILFRQDKRALHDFMSSSYVLKTQ